MNNRNWYFSSDDLVRELKLIRAPRLFEFDQTVHTWQVSYFRFIRASCAEFSSIAEFTAMALFTTPRTLRDVVEWTQDAFITPLLNNPLGGLEAARCDYAIKDEGDRKVPDWLTLDGEMIDAFQLCSRGGDLCDMAEHFVYRTKTSYFYLCINRES